MTTIDSPAGYRNVLLRWLGLALWLFVLLPGHLALASPPLRDETIRIVPAGPKGGFWEQSPGAQFEFRVLAGPCRQIELPQVQNPAAAEIIKTITPLGNDYYRVTMGQARGVARIEVRCAGNSAVAPASILVSGDCGRGLITAEEIESWLKQPPPPLQFTEDQRQQLRKLAQNVPDVKLMKVPPPEQSIGPVILLGTCLAVGGVALGINLAEANSSGPPNCTEGYSPCDNYNACCPDLEYFCPEDGKCYHNKTDALYCPGNTVICHY